MDRVRWPQRCLSVLLLIPVVATACGSSGEGRVLAEGKNVGEFEASRNPFEFEAADARRFVITKVEVFGPGQLDGFPGTCSGTLCAATPDEWPIVVISAEVEPACHRSAHELIACASVISAQCALGEEFPEPPTYIWWERDSAGNREPHGCAYSGIEGESDLNLLGFAPRVRTLPTRLSLVVQGRDVPIAGRMPSP